MHDTSAFFAIINHKAKMQWFLLRQLPAAYFSGVRIVAAQADNSKVAVPFTWLTQNPFRSTYFASLSMAAELSTGILVMAQLYKRRPAASMLLVAMEGTFYKKATGRTVFNCLDGVAIAQTVQQAYDTIQPQRINVASTGYNKDGEKVAEFHFTWSVKVK